MHEHVFVRLLQGVRASHLQGHRRASVFCSVRHRASCLLHACVSCANNCFGTTGDLKLAENSRDMIAHGLGTDHEMFGNGRIGIPLRDQQQDLTLTLGEFREVLWRGCVAKNLRGMLGM